MVLPSTVVANNAHRFEEILRQIDIPLVSYGAELEATSQEDGWLEYFFRTSLEADLIRWMVLWDLTELVRRAVKYVNAFPTLVNKHLGPVVGGAILAVCGEELAWRVNEALKSNT